MSTTPPTGLWHRWLAFWFAPVDPTPLGFIRVVTGVMVLYTHLAYCFDLQAFFGPHGWYGLAEVNRERHEQPAVLTSFWTWDDSLRGAHIPEFPHRKQAVMAWVRSLPADRPGLEPALKYLDRAQATGRDVNAQNLIAFALPVAGELTFDRDPAVRAAQVGRLVQEKYVERIGTKDFGSVIPKELADLPTDGKDTRAAAAKELTDFLASLPADPTARTFVVNHLLEQSLGSRNEFLKFLRDLASAEPDERARRLDYMEYWNQEQRYNFRTGSPIFSLWFHVTDPLGMAVAHGVALAIMALFTVGLWTRVTSVLTWLVVVSYIHRTQQVLFGMDTMMNILLIYLAVGNSGAALSVDRLAARYRAARLSLARSGTLDAPTRAFLDRPPASLSAGFALRMLQVHFCFIYGAAGLSKLMGAAWWNTNAYWDTLVNPEFTMIHYQWYEWLLRQSFTTRPVYHVAAAVGVLFTLVTEIALPFLVWTKLRPYVVVMGVMFHAGVAIFMGLWVFSLLMMTMLFGYLPGCVIRERLFGTPSTDTLAVRANRKSEPHLRAAALAVAADFDGQITVSDGPGFAVESNGKSLTGPDAANELFARLSWLRSSWWLKWVPGVTKALGPK